MSFLIPTHRFCWLTDPNLNSLCMLFRLYTVYYFQYTYYNFLQTSICAWFKGFFQCFWRVLTGRHRRKRRSRRPSWEMGWYYGGCLEFPGKWMKKNHYVRQSPSECLVMSSGRFGEKEHSINRHERLVLGCDEQRWAVEIRKMLHAWHSNYSEGRLNGCQGVPTRHCCKFNQHPLKRCYAATRYGYCMYVYTIPTIPYILCIYYTVHSMYMYYIIIHIIYIISYAKMMCSFWACWDLWKLA